MAHLENAGYRLLSFKYIPNPNQRKMDEKRLEDRDGAGNGDKATLKCADGGLSSVSSLIDSIREIKTDAGSEPREPSPAVASEPADRDNSGTASAPAAPTTPTPLTEFHLLGDLPAELRLKIWDLTFLPRVVELRPTRPNYSPGHDDGRRPQWQSGCSNPAALSVSVEAREFALEHFRVAFPLAAIGTRHEIASPWLLNAAGRPPAEETRGATDATGASKGRLLRRTLYVSPDDDTVCLLGPDSDFSRMRDVLQAFSEADPLGKGIRRLALSVRGWGFGGSAVMMKGLGRTILGDLEQLVLFMYGERRPPEEWRERGATFAEGDMLEKFRTVGNKLELVPCEGGSAWYAYRIWSGGKGRQFWDEDGNIMRIGRNRIRVMDLEFKDGW